MRRVEERGGERKKMKTVNPGMIKARKTWYPRKPKYNYLF